MSVLFNFWNPILSAKLRKRLKLIIAECEHTEIEIFMCSNQHEKKINQISKKTNRLKCQRDTNVWMKFSLLPNVFSPLQSYLWQKRWDYLLISCLTSVRIIMILLRRFACQKGNTKHANIVIKNYLDYLDSYVSYIKIVITASKVYSYISKN